MDDLNRQGDCTDPEGTVGGSTREAENTLDKEDVSREKDELSQTDVNETEEASEETQTIEKPPKSNGQSDEHLEIKSTELESAEPTAMTSSTDPTEPAPTELSPTDTKAAESDPTAAESNSTAAEADPTAAEPIPSADSNTLESNQPITYERPPQAIPLQPPTSYDSRTPPKEHSRTPETQGNIAMAKYGGRDINPLVLYISGLDSSVKEHTLMDMFKVTGTVKSVKFFPDRQKANSNFAFVEYQDKEAAKSAISTLDKSSINGRQISISYAFQTKVEKDFNLFVGDLGPDVNDEMLHNHFAHIPELQNARVMWDMTTGRSRGYGFVSFDTKQGAERGLEANGSILGSRAIRANWASTRRAGGGASGGGGNMSMHGMGNFQNQSYGNHNQGHYGNQPNYGQGNYGQGDYGNQGNYNQGNYNQGNYNQGNYNQGNYGNHGNFGSHGNFGGPGNYGNQGNHNFGGNYNNQGGFGNQGNHGGRHHGQGGHNANPRNYRDRNDRKERKDRPNPNELPKTVYIGNLPNMNPSELIPLLQNFGYVVEFKHHSNYAFVSYDSHQRAQMAMTQLNGYSIHGRTLKCGWGRDRQGK